MIFTFPHFLFRCRAAAPTPSRSTVHTWVTDRNDAMAAGASGTRRAVVDLWSGLPDFTAEAGELRMRGRAVQLKGASWFGMDGTGRVPDGLWVHDVDWYVDFLARRGFNALRLPFALDNVFANEAADDDMVTGAPALRGVAYLDVLEHVVDAAARRGLLVLLDLQRLQASRWPDDGLWYAPGVTLQTVKDAWDRVQQRVCNRWNGARPPTAATHAG